MAENAMIGAREDKAPIHITNFQGKGCNQQRQQSNARGGGEILNAAQQEDHDKCGESLVIAINRPLIGSLLPFPSTFTLYVPYILRNEGQT